MESYSKRSQKQPGLAIIKHQARNIAALARTLGVREYELRAALHGEIRPNAAVRERLPMIVGVPLEVLFTEDALTVVERHPEPVP